MDKIKDYVWLLEFLIKIGLDKYDMKSKNFAFVNRINKVRYFHILSNPLLFFFWMNPIHYLVKTNVNEFENAQIEMIKISHKCANGDNLAINLRLLCNLNLKCSLKHPTMTRNVNSYININKRLANEC